MRGSKQIGQHSSSLVDKSSLFTATLGSWHEEEFVECDSRRNSIHYLHEENVVT
jgi:hypothetical protein